MQMHHVIYKALDRLLQTLAALGFAEHLFRCTYEESHALARIEQSLRSEISVCFGHGVGIDRQLHRECTHARQLVALDKVLSGDSHADAIYDLFEDGAWIAGFYGEF